MATGYLTIQFNGLCCLYYPKTQARCAVLVEGSAGNSISYDEKTVGNKKTKFVEPHTAYVGVSNPSGMISSTGVKLDKLSSNVWGYRLGAGEVISYTPKDPNTYSATLNYVQGLTSVFDGFTFDPAFLVAGNSTVAAVVPLPGGDLTDFQQQGVVMSMLSVEVELKNNRFELTRRSATHSENLLLDAGTTLLIGNEMPMHLGNPGGMATHHFLLYTRLAKESRVVLKKVSFAALVKRYGLVEAIRLKKRAAGLGCSNSQYP